MRLQNAHAFERHIRDAIPDHVLPLYALFAKDDTERAYLKKRLLEKLKAFSAKKIPIDCRNLKPNALASTLQEQNFFSKNRLFIFQEAENLKKDAAKVLLDFFQKKTKSIICVLTGSSFKMPSSIGNEMEKIGLIVDLNRENPKTRHLFLREVIEKRLQEENKTIDKSALDMLAQNVPYAFLDNELEKLLCFPKTHITIEDAEGLCYCMQSCTGWEVTEALMQKDLSRALSIVRKLLDESTPFLSLVRQIRYELCQMLNLAMLIAQGMPKNKIKEHFPKMPYSIFERKCRHVLPVKTMQTALQRLDQTELCSRTASLPLHLLLETYLLRALLP